MGQDKVHQVQRIQGGKAEQEVSAASLCRDGDMEYEDTYVSTKHDEPGVVQAREAVLRGQARNNMSGLSVVGAQLQCLHSTWCNVTLHSMPMVRASTHMHVDIGGCTHL